MEESKQQHGATWGQDDWPRSGQQTGVQGIIDSKDRGRLCSSAAAEEAACELGDNKNLGHPFDAANQSRPWWPAFQVSTTRPSLWLRLAQSRRPADRDHARRPKKPASPFTSLPTLQGEILRRQLIPSQPSPVSLDRLSASASIVSFGFFSPPPPAIAAHRIASHALDASLGFTRSL